MKKKRPLILIVGVALLVAFSVFNYFHQVQIWKDVFSDYQLERERNIESLSKISGRLAKSGLHDEIRKILDDAREAKYIDFYILQLNGEPVAWGTDDGKPDVIDIEYTRLNEPVITEFESVLSVPLEGNYILTIGIIKRWDRFLAEMTERSKGGLFDETLLFLLIGLTVFSYYLKDILQVLKIFQQSDKRNYKGIRSKTLESQMIVQGLTGYEQTVKALSEQNDALGKQVLPALKNEILSGKVPPYDFECTLVRTDINNFSSIFHNHDVNVFMQVINRFFQEVSHIVSRYNGLIHEFLGDEVIFYFKDEDHSNSFLTAVSAIRDINEAAFRVHQETLNDLGYPFTVKSSLAHGKIRFGPLVNGYSLAGSILIETVRILSEVVEKDGNVVCFERAYLGRVNEFCDVTEVGRVRLKGFQGSKTLYSYQRHRDLTDVLNSLTVDDVENISYYRSDADISEILRFLRTRSTDLQVAVLLGAIQALRGYSLTKSDGSPLRELLKWIDEMESDDREVESGRRYRVMSASVMLFMNLVPVSHYSPELEKRLSRLLKTNDKRVVANVLEVLTHFKFDGDPSFYKHLVEYDDNRILANALVREGMRDLNSDIVRRIKRMLHSKSEGHQASGLYAIGELALFHRTRDKVYYETRLEFLRMVNSLPDYLASQNTMVRRQALVATRKSGDEKVIEMVHAKARADKTGVLSSEVELYLGTIDSEIGHGIRRAA